MNAATRDATAPPPGLRREQLADGVLRWVLDNPARRNAIAPPVLRWIAARCSELRGEVVIVRGAGERSFCAGFDLSALEGELARLRAGEIDSPEAALIEATSAMHRADATFIAAINGYAIGAGVELVASCDLRIARHGASLRVPAGKLGVVYHAAGLLRMHAAFGPTLTRRLLLVGEQIAIEEAAAGLVALVTSEQLDAATLDLARRLREQDPTSVAGNRRLLRALDSVQTLPQELLDGHEAARRSAYQALAERRDRARPPSRDSSGDVGATRDLE